MFKSGNLKIYIYYFVLIVLIKTVNSKSTVMSLSINNIHILNNVYSIFDIH